jgi:hypothetical protein
MGRLVALLYLVCVLAPGVALATGFGPTPCFDELPVAAVEVSEAHLHNGDSPAMQMHGGAASHDHATEGLSRRADAGGQHEHNHHGHSGPGPCCAMLCMPGIAADFPSFVFPAQPVSTVVSAPDQSTHGDAPARLYRPPII